MENYLIHFGNKNSGRYPRGTGENPHQHDGLRSSFNRKKERQSVRIKRRETARDSHKLSDDELNNQINRLRKEKELKTLTKEVNQGRGILNATLKQTFSRSVGAIAGATAGAIGAMIANNYIKRG